VKKVLKKRLKKIKKRLDNRIIMIIFIVTKEKDARMKRGETTTIKRRNENEDDGCNKDARIDRD